MDSSGNSPPAEGIFTRLRSQVLYLDPSSVGLEPTLGLLHVFGVVMDTTYENGTGTVIALADGTASLYTSTGGGVIGSGGWSEVRSAVAELLRLVESNLGLLGDDLSSTLPGPGRVTITALTYAGRRSVSAPEDDLGHSRHRASQLFHSVHQVISEMRRAEELYRHAREARPDGTTRLMAAAHAGDDARIALLLDHGAEIDAKDDQGYTALMFAANSGRDQAVRLLLSRGADPNATDLQRSTPLMFAAQHDHINIVRQLLDSGADPNARGDHGLTALGFALQNGHQLTASVLGASGAR